MNRISSADVRTASVTGDETRTEASAVRTDQNAIPALEDLLGTLSASSRAALQQLARGRRLRLAKLGSDHDLYGRRVVFRRSAHHYGYARRPTMILASKGFSPVPLATAINQRTTRAYTGLHGATQDHMEYHMTDYII